MKYRYDWNSPAHNPDQDNCELAVSYDHSTEQFVFEMDGEELFYCHRYEVEGLQRFLDFVLTDIDIEAEADE